VKPAEEAAATLDDAADDPATVCTDSGQLLVSDVELFAAESASRHDVVYAADLTRRALMGALAIEELLCPTDGVRVSVQGRRRTDDAEGDARTALAFVEETTVMVMARYAADVSRLWAQEQEEEAAHAAAAAAAVPANHEDATSEASIGEETALVAVGTVVNALRLEAAVDGEHTVRCDLVYAADLTRRAIMDALAIEEAQCPTDSIRLSLQGPRAMGDDERELRAAVTTEEVRAALELCESATRLSLVGGTRLDELLYEAQADADRIAREEDAAAKARKAAAASPECARRWVPHVPTNAVPMGTPGRLRQRIAAFGVAGVAGSPQQLSSLLARFSDSCITSPGNRRAVLVDDDLVMRPTPRPPPASASPRRRLPPDAAS
jgi:hypothetical protein